MWDSGPVNSSESYIVYGGAPLEYITNYYLRIMLYNGELWGRWAEARFICRNPSGVIVPDMYETISEAITGVEAFDTIVVMPGTYVENINFMGKPIVLKAAGLAEETIIQSAESSTPVVTFNSGEDLHSVLDGFTIEGAIGASGILCNGGSPVIQNCDIRNNHDAVDGGGIGCFSSGAIIRHNRIFENSCTKSGAGIGGTGTICPTIEYNEIFLNVSPHGSGIGFVNFSSGLTVHHNVIHHNTGGGIYGGGIYLHGSSSNIYNNTITENTRGIRIRDGGEVNVRNNIIASNAGMGLDPIGTTYNYNNVWNNVSHNDIGPDGISVDPLFVDQYNQNYALQSLSPCINAGDPSPIYNDPDGTVNDIGALFVPQMLPIANSFEIEPRLQSNIVTSLVPEFSWEYYDDEATVQTMYQIQVGIDLNWGEAELWDTGPVSGSESYIVYDGSPLENRTEYYARVRVHDGEDWGGWNWRMFVPIVSSVIRVPDHEATIQAAIDRSFQYDTVLVAPGEYYENIDFGGRKIVVVSEAGPKSTFLRPANPDASTIVFGTSEDNSTVFKGFTVEDGNVAVTVFIGPYSSPIIEGNVFRYNIPGVINPLTVIKAEGDAIIRRNLFYGNNGINTIWATGRTYIINNTIVGNARGIYAQYSMPVVLNNIVAQNAGYGIYFGDYSILDYNNVWENGSDNYGGPNGINADPLFWDADANDYRLLYGSPCLDAGHPGEEYYDLDGSRNDIGAFPLLYELPIAQNIAIGPEHILDSFITSLTPTFSWDYFDTAATTQNMYQIQIGLDDNWTSVETWDSGPVNSDQTTITYDGPSLSDRVKYFVRLRLNNGVEWGAWMYAHFKPVIQQTIIVPDAYSTIQTAIDSALPFDTILVKPGVYTENIYFTEKPLKLMSTGGRDSTFIEPAGQAPIVNFYNIDDTIAVIDGFTLRNSVDHQAIYIEDASPIVSNCDISYCTVNNNSGCISFEGGAPIIRNNNIHHNYSEDSFPGIMGEHCNRGGTRISENKIYANTGPYSAAMFLFDVVNCTISYNEIYDNIAIDESYEDVVIVYDCSNSIIRDNNICNNSAGLRLLWSNDIQVYNNIITGNQHTGLRIEGNSDPDIDYNNIWDNGEDHFPGAHGIADDPEFVDPENGNFNLRVYSPCIDAGHPDPEYNDPDGTRNDIGARPYVESTEDEYIIPTPEWISLYCTAPAFDGELLVKGDIIKAYDPRGVLCGIDTVDTEGKYGFMNVYRDDPFSTYDEGAEPGDIIGFKINNQPATAIPEVIWVENGDQCEVCDFSKTVSMNIELSEGWNLVSWPINTGGQGIGDALSDIIENVIIVHSFEDGGLTYNPQLPEFATLEFSDPYHGYWLNMQSDDVLTVSGTIVDPADLIYLERGWNLVSYLPRSEMGTPTALISIDDNLEIVLGYDAGEPGTYDPMLPEFSTLPYLKPERGYWIKVGMEDILSYPGADGAIRSGQVLAAGEKSSDDRLQKSRLWIDIYADEMHLDNELLIAGTKIEAVDSDGKIVGLGVAGENGRFGFMAVYGDDPLTEQDEGLESGEKFSLVIDGSDVLGEWQWNLENKFIEIGELRSANLSNIPTEFKLYDNYPNPFNPTTNIKLALPEDDMVKLCIYNILGQEVIELLNSPMPAGVHTIKWDGRDQRGNEVSSGVYFYRAATAKHNESKKMILLK